MLRLNRRQLTGSFLAGMAAAAATANANAQAPAAQETPAGLLDAAKRNITSNRAALEKFKLPMAVEPASSFKAF